MTEYERIQKNICTILVGYIEQHVDEKEVYRVKNVTYLAGTSYFFYKDV